MGNIISGAGERFNENEKRGWKTTRKKDENEKDTRKLIK